MPANLDALPMKNGLRRDAFVSAVMLSMATAGNVQVGLRRTELYVVASLRITYFQFPSLIAFPVSPTLRPTKTDQSVPVTPVLQRTKMDHVFEAANNLRFLMPKQEGVIAKVGILDL